jgi:hypothetical protein
MNKESMATEPSLSIGSCCSLASEVWRLKRCVNSLGNETEVVSLRYSIRQLTRVLDELKIAVVDLVGQPYDSGMIQEVLEVLDGPGLLNGQLFIAETISPTVTWNGTIAQPGQITLRRLPLPDSSTPEVSA